MNITIYDIAQKCNVSIATVSRVLNGSTRVSEKTRAKVLQVMKEMGYKPNPFARGLGLDSMKIVGVICTDVADIFYAYAVSLLEDGLRKHHFDVMLSNTGSDTGHNGKYISAMADKHVDAIITIGTPFSSESDIRQLCETARQIPVITINSDYHQPNMYSVVCNEKEGMKMVIAALAAKNCQDILYIYDSLTYSGRHKLDGFRQGIREWRLTEKPELIQQIPRTLQDTEALIDRLVADDIPFDAIVTSEDIFAVAAQRAALRHGKNIPVIGCNNSILAQCATPTITSLDNKLTSLCNAAVHIVTELTGKEADSVPVRTEFSADLVVSRGEKRGCRTCDSLFSSFKFVFFSLQQMVKNLKPSSANDKLGTINYLYRKYSGYSFFSTSTSPMTLSMCSVMMRFASSVLPAKIAPTMLLCCS